MNHKNISIEEASSISEFWKYFVIVIRGHQRSWVLWILIMKFFGRERCQWFVVKDKGYATWSGSRTKEGLDK